MEVINKQELMEKLQDNQFLSRMDIEYIESIIETVTTYDYDPSYVAEKPPIYQTEPEVFKEPDKPTYETESQVEREQEKKMSVFERLQMERHRCSDYFSGLLKEGSTFIDFQTDVFQADALRPYNPVTGERIDGGDRLKFAAKSQEYWYLDPRWATLEQWNAMGYRIKKSAKATKRERWILYERRPVLDHLGKPITDESGKPITQQIPLEKPRLSYENWFNAAQVWDPVRAEGPGTVRLPDCGDTLENVAAILLAVCPCEIQYISSGMPTYDEKNDVITVREDYYAKNPASFLQSLIRNMVHATGHRSRNNRYMGAADEMSMLREEMIAEIAAIYFAGDMGIMLQGQTDVESKMYGQFANMIQDLGANELYRIAREADKAVKQIERWYSRKHKLDLSVPIEKHVKVKQTNRWTGKNTRKYGNDRRENYGGKSYNESKSYSGGKSYNSGRQRNYNGKTFFN